jgi:hypothetical protein
MKLACYLVGMHRPNLTKSIDPPERRENPITNPETIDYLVDFRKNI